MMRVLFESCGKLNEIPFSAPIRLGEPPKWGSVMILAGEFPSSVSLVISCRERAPSASLPRQYAIASSPCSARPNLNVARRSRDAKARGCTRVFRQGDSPFSVRGSRNSGPDAPSDALAPSGQERRDSRQDLGRVQPLCGVSGFWVARSGTMPQADLDNLL